jgi:hypothetical protein
VPLDDDDDWPEPEADPEKLAQARKTLAGMAAVRRRALRWAYAGLGVLLIVVIVLALTR